MEIFISYAKRVSECSTKMAWDYIFQTKMIGNLLFLIYTFEAVFSFTSKRLLRMTGDIDLLCYENIWINLYIQ